MAKELICPKCSFEQEQSAECLKCGIVFAKFVPDRSLASGRSHGPRFPSRLRLAEADGEAGHPTEEHPAHSETAEMLDTADRWIYPIRKKTIHNQTVSPGKNNTEIIKTQAGFSNGVNRTGKYFIIGLMSMFFFYMVIKRSSWCFLDYVNLPFHESGHIIFSPFGETISFLGGTIGQLMWPLILMIYFMTREEPLSAAFCLFWFGENFLNISKYIADARSMLLPLVGGGIHDWNFLLGKWHVLRYDKTIAGVVFAIGVVLMTGSMVWAFFARPERAAD